MNTNSLPFTYNNIIKSKIGKDVKTILDVGCGRGELMEYLNAQKKYKITGVDLYKDSLKDAKKTKAYSQLVQGDVRKLKFKKNSFDLVICSMTIEHLKKKEGFDMLKKMELIASKQVIVTTTVGFFPFHPLEGDDDNPYQVHQSGWSVKDFKKKGYKVYGQGADFVYGKVRLNIILNSPLKHVLFAASYGLSPYWYFYPEKASYMICVKNDTN